MAIVCEPVQAHWTILNGAQQWRKMLSTLRNYNKFIYNVHNCA